jgi:F-box-like
MPKAKFKRKGAPIDLAATSDLIDSIKRRRTRSENATAVSSVAASAVVSATGDKTTTNTCGETSSECSILHLPEEVICLIVGLLEDDVASLAALEASCRRLRQVIVDARLWRRLLVSKLEQEPGLRGFLSTAWQERLGEELLQTPEEDQLR